MNRVHQVLQKLQQRGYQALFTRDPYDLFYFTGIPFATGALVIEEQGAHLFLDSRFIDEAAPLASTFHLCCIPSMRDLVPSLQQALPHVRETMIFCPKKTSYDLFCALQEFSAASGSTLKADKEFFSELRRTKDESERACIQKAVQITEDVVGRAFTHCKKGVTEKELACFLKRGFLEQGADMAFEPIVAFGKNSACPHWTPTDEPFSDQELVLIDCGAKWQQYDSDMTRVFFYKKPCQELKQAFDAVQRAYEAAALQAKPGVSSSFVYDVAYKELAGLAHLFTHGLGHGVGLEIHESPYVRKECKDTFLQVGDVITIEPGVYIPGVGGIRLENTLFIEPQGAVSMMKMPFVLST